MHIVTCISDATNQGYREYLAPSCAYFGLSLLTLLYEDEWSTNRIKDLALFSHLKTLRRDEVVLCTDGYDTMFACDEGEIMRRYATFDRPLVFTAETNCWPCPELARHYPESSGSRRYLNCGGFIGEAGVIVDLLARYLPETPPMDRFLQASGLTDPEAARTRGQELEAKYWWSNQFVWTLIYLHHPDLIALDQEATLFLSLATDLSLIAAHKDEYDALTTAAALYRKECDRLTRECVISDLRLRYAPTGSYPCQIHLNSRVVRLMARNGFFDGAMPWLS